MLPMRGIEEGFIGCDESRPATELQAAASMAAGRYRVDSGRGWAQSSPVRGGGDRGRGEKAVGARNRGEVRRGWSARRGRRGGKGEHSSGGG